MLDGISELLEGWRTLAHISEWSGISVGALLVGAAVVWFNPGLLKPVLWGAAFVIVGYAGVIYGDTTGRADTQKQWDAARAAAIAAEKQRDADAASSLEAKYKPRLEALQKLADERKAQGDAYEQKIADLTARPVAAAPARKPAGASCLLGELADRLRGRRQAH